MNTRALLAVLGVLALAVAWWLISPLWRTTRLDEALPAVSATPSPVIKDSMETMDAPTKERFREETEKVKDRIMKEADAMPSSAPVAPIVLGEAAMVARAHDVEGRALLLQAGSGTILRFENLKTINGPDLRIYLSAGLNNDDFIDLGPIRATEGNVNYALPPGADTAKYRNALIWCRAFHVLFSYAEL